MDRSEAAEEIVSAAASRLCLDMRFLTMAVLSLERRVLPGEGRPECDGVTVTFHEDTVIADYRNDRNLVTRELAHCVLHCILGHDSPGMSVHGHLAEDMVVEYVLDTLDTPHVTVPQRDDRMYACEKIFRRAGAPAPDLVAQELSGISEWQLDLYLRLFDRDRDQSHGTGDAGMWRELAQQAMTEVEGFARRTSSGTDAFLSILRIRNRRRYDYRSFLRKFMTRRSGVRESMDEFDPIYYTYGLSHYGNMPLVDSLEVSESPRVDEFVVAIDTSGSTMRGPVMAFLEETFSVLRQSGLEGRANIHVIQCDDEVRSDDVVRSEGDMRRLASSFRLRGGNGTDFRPVFSYVDELVRDGGFRNLRGLMYFTDGVGTYPERRPPYDTAFVFCDDRYLEHDVPPWAMRLVVRSADLTAREGA